MCKWKDQQDAMIIGISYMLQQHKRLGFYVNDLFHILQMFTNYHTSLGLIGF